MPADHLPDRNREIPSFNIRIAEVFPPYASGDWSPLEKGVFNGLLANLIQRRGSAAVTREALERVHQDMVDVVEKYRAWQTGR